MTDLFALFDEPRRPWLDPDKLKAKFLELSAAVHPDRTHNASEPERFSATQQYVELNGAYHTLREPKERIQLLIELERGTKPDQVQPIDMDGVALFTEVGQLCRAADTLIEERSRQNSPLLRVRFFEQAAELADQLRDLQSKLNRKQDALDDELRSLNPIWNAAPAAGSPARVDALPCDRLEEMYRDFSYLKRWTQQLQNRLVPLCLEG